CEPKWCFRGMAENFSVVLQGLYLDPDIPFALYMFDVSVNVVFSIITIIGNSLIMAALWKIPFTQVHTVLKAFLFNLALADLGVGLIVQPLYISSVLTATSGYQNASRILGAVFYLGNWCLPNVSIVFLTAIAVDRFLALYLRLRYRTVVTLKKVVTVLAALWVFTFASTLLIVYNSKIYNIAANVTLAVCLSLTTFCYLKIYLTLRRHNNCVRIPLQTANASCQREISSQQRFNIMRYRRSVWNMLYVYGAFLFCSLPLFCILIVIHVRGVDRTMKISRFLAATLIFINCSLNPILYCWKIREIRRVVLTILSGIFCR
ncbi:hypothetical protein ACROYT_G033739, partial [Oculina patagonica]